MKIIGLIALLLVTQGDLVKVETTFDKTAKFSAFHTYSWSPGAESFNPDVHKNIVAAFDDEMSKLGFTKVTENGDVRLAYYVVARTDVDLKTLDSIKREDNSGPAATKTVGRLVAAMRGPTSRDPLWSASTHEVVDPDPAKLGATIRSVAARLFETYPGRPAARK